LIIISFISCTSEEEKRKNEINEQSKEILSAALDEIITYKLPLYSEDLMKEYLKISTDRAELGLEYAKKIKYQVIIMKQVKDSILQVKQDSIVKATEIAEKKWESTKAGQIHKKHPNWSKEECELLAARKIWIGMNLDMLKYLRGNPNHANPSNYGNGTEWQWCWDDYSPSCFYGKDDGIITAYN